MERGRRPSPAPDTTAGAAAAASDGDDEDAAADASAADTTDDQQEKADESGGLDANDGTNENGSTGSSEGASELQLLQDLRLTQRAMSTELATLATAVAEVDAKVMAVGDAVDRGNATRGGDDSIAAEAKGEDAAAAVDADATIDNAAAGQRNRAEVAP